MPKEIAPISTSLLNPSTTSLEQPAGELTSHNKRLTVCSNAQPVILEMLLKELKTDDRKLERVKTD